MENNMIEYVEWEKRFRCLPLDKKIEIANEFLSKEGEGIYPFDEEHTNKYFTSAYHALNSLKVKNILIDDFFFLNCEGEGETMHQEEVEAFIEEFLPEVYDKKELWEDLEFLTMKIC